jgi:flagellar biosynthetic protein FliR
MNITLESLLVGELFATLLVFARVGSAIMLMPGVGELYVPLRVRLLFALTLSYVVAPILSPLLPSLPASAGVLVLLLIGEITIGIFMGMMTKTLLATMHIAGMLIASHSNFAAAMLFDASQNTQGATIGVFLGLTALLVMIATNLHLVMIEAFMDSYSLMTPGQALPAEDMANYSASMLGESFRIALQLSVPFIFTALIVNLGAGILSRLMPQFQVFFILMPLQIKLSLLVLFVVLGAIMVQYEAYVRQTMESFLA